MECPSCGGKELEIDQAGGDTICVACGVVLEESTIVNQVEFQEGSGGASSAIGKFVSETCTQPYNRTAGGYGYSQPSREITLANNRRKIQQVAAALRLGEHFVDAAHRLYALALQRNFVMGRRSAHVTAACLYTVCRQERSPHMLIDFSDVAQVNVYRLGATFLRFRRLLGLRLPLVDPSLFIHRYAARLELGDKTNPIATTALRVVARMKRDWLGVGRRPSGLCAAALLIAARMHGVPLIKDDVARVMHVCGATVAHRLREFERTPAAFLSVDQFAASEEDHTACPLADLEFDPPAFVRNQIREGKVTSALDTTVNGAAAEEAGNGGDAASSLAVKAASAPAAALKLALLDSFKACMAENIDLVEAPGAWHKGHRKGGGRRRIAKGARELIAERAWEDLYDKLEEDLEEALKKEKKEGTIIMADVYDPGPKSEAALAVKVEDRPKLQKMEMTPIDADDILAIGMKAVKESRATLKKEMKIKKEEKRPPEGGAGAVGNRSEEAEHHAEPDEEEVPEETLSDVDDEGLDDLLLNDEERKKKELVWSEIHRDYLHDQEEKKRMALLDPDDGGGGEGGGSRKKGKHGHHRKGGKGGKAAAAAAAAAALAGQKKISRKIDYSALDGLFNADGGLGGGGGGDGGKGADGPTGSSADDLTARLLAQATPLGDDDGEGGELLEEVVEEHHHSSRSDGSSATAVASSAAKIGSSSSGTTKAAESAAGAEAVPKKDSKALQEDEEEDEEEDDDYHGEGQNEEYYYDDDYGDEEL